MFNQCKCAVTISRNVNSAFNSGPSLSISVVLGKNPNILKNLSCTDAINSLSSSKASNIALIHTDTKQFLFSTVIVLRYFQPNFIFTNR